jgi:hypothetical protein
MSRFYASVTNNRSTITKCGHKTGLEAYIGGWNIGVKIVCKVDSKDRDVIEVYETAGSNDKLKCSFLAELTK